MPATDPHELSARAVTAPATDAFAISPSDTAEFTRVARAVYVGGGGDVALVTRAGTAITLRGVGAGSVLPVSARAVRATGTTAADLVGLL